MLEMFLNSEYFLSTLGFKNHILDTHEANTVHNSVYMADIELPRNFIMSQFLSDAKSGKIKSSDIGEVTLENFSLLIHIIKGLK
jgi:hypothetical protein